jgi:hypothetical protein
MATMQRMDGAGQVRVWLVLAGLALVAALGMFGGGGGAAAVGRVRYRADAASVGAPAVRASDGAVIGGLSFARAAPLVGPAKMRRARDPNPRIGLLAAIPSTLPASGGTVRLLVVVQGASSCRWRSAAATSALRWTNACASGRASTGVKLPRNTTRSTITYRFSVTARGPGGRSSAGTVRVLERAAASAGGAAPTITTQPFSQFVVAGASASLTAAASGRPTPRVQWQVSTNAGSVWRDIAGATATTYSFIAAQGEDGSEYRAVFTNAAGSATTIPATLFLSATATDPTAAPVVMVQPLSQSVLAGASASFTATASGNPAPTVQWQVSTDSGASWGDVAGANAASYSFPAAQAENGYLFRAVFANVAGVATTDPALLAVSTPTTAPAVTVQPLSQSVAAGTTVSFSATASGSPPPIVQWQVSTDGGASWGDVAGATSTTYSFTAMLSDTGDQYRATFTNSAGSATTNTATLAVSSASSAPAVTTQPLNESVLPNTAATFSAAASGNPAPTVQWQVSINDGASWGDVAGATSTTYSFTATPGQSGDEYRAIFTNALGSATTGPAALTVSSTAITPTVTTQPQGQSVASGTSASFTAGASGNPTPTVLWQVSTDGGASWANITGATATTYSFIATPSENGYAYRAVFTNSAGSATSNAATLTVTSPSTLFDYNWSGYVATEATFSSVTGSWSVPAVTCSPGETSDSAQWVGIDGAQDSTVEQDGSQSDCNAGSPSYGAWYEMYGDPDVNGGASVQLPETVLPGDVMNASVSLSGSTWVLAIADTTRPWTVQVPIASPSPAPLQSSAEWIVERPQVGNSLASLPDFGVAAFSAATADGDGQTGPIASFFSAPVEMISTNGSPVLAAPGALNTTGNGFSDTWYAAS